MLADLGRRRLYRGRGTRQLHRLSQHVEAAELRMLDRGGDTEVLYLRIGEHLVDAVDRAAGNAAAVQLRHPFLARAGGEAFIEDRVEAGAVRGALLVVPEFVARDQVFAADDVAQALPHALPRSRDVDVAVGGLVGRGRHAGRLVVADLRRDFAFHQVARRRCAPAPAPAARSPT